MLLIKGTSVPFFIENKLLTKTNSKMSRYNTPTKKTPEVVVNFQGGEGYKLNPKYELISILNTDFNNTYYEKLSDREIRFKNLVNEIAKTDVEFVAKALVYTRSVVGLRTVTHLGATFLTPFLSGSDLGKRFFSKRDRNGKKGGIVYRLDDMLEITACYMALNPGKSLPNSMKKGFKLALENADTYELAKYQAKNKNISLVDIVNLVRPKPSEKMVESFKNLMNGGLKQFNTVEDKNTEAGKVVSNKLKSGEITKEQAEVQLNAAKEENYMELISTKKIGYLALLRNLRNILKTSGSSELLDGAVSLLTDETFIRKSLVFPHQIDLALEVLLSEFPTTNAGMRKIIVALDKAYELSVPNLTELFTHGKTAVVLDTSDSMTGQVKYEGGKKGSNKSRLDKASLVAATLAKGVNADVYHFASYCEPIKFNPLDSINTLKNTFMGYRGKVGHGTSFNSIFNTIGEDYTRVIIISDMQGSSYISPGSYKNMYVYAVHMDAYGTTMFKPSNKVYDIFGYGSDIYEYVKKAELDPKAIIKEIESIVI